MDNNEMNTEDAVAMLVLVTITLLAACILL